MFMLPKPSLQDTYQCKAPLSLFMCSDQMIIISKIMILDKKEFAILSKWFYERKWKSQDQNKSSQNENEIHKYSQIKIMNNISIEEK